MSRPILFLIAVAFVLLGAYLYRNPRKVGPSWAAANENVRLQSGAAFGILMMFAGLYVLFANLLALLIRGVGLLCLPLSALATWLLVKRVLKPSINLADSPPK